MFKFIFRILFNRLLIFFVSFVTAIGIPFLTFNTEWRNAAWSKVQGVGSQVASSGKSWFASKPAAVPVTTMEEQSDSNSDGTPTAPPPALSGAQVSGLHEIIDWRITPQHVTSRWTRVSTAYDEPSMGWHESSRFHRVRSRRLGRFADLLLRRQL